MRIKSKAARSKAKLTPYEQKLEDERFEASNAITRAKLKEILPQITYHASAPPRMDGCGAEVEAIILEQNPELAAACGIDEERIAASFAYEAANEGRRLPWPKFEEQKRCTWKQAKDGSWKAHYAEPQVFDEDDSWETRNPKPVLTEDGCEVEEPDPNVKDSYAKHFTLHSIVIDHSEDFTQSAHIDIPIDITHWELFKGGMSKSGKKAICQSHPGKPDCGVSPLPLTMI